MSIRLTGGGRTADLVDLVEHRAGADAQRNAYRFLADGITESGSLTFERVHRRATAIGAALQALGASGERVLITYPGAALEEYVSGFLGCVMAGAVAVPCDSPSSRGGLERLVRIAVDCTPSVVLGPTAQAAALQSSVPGARHLDSGTVPDAAADDWRRPAVGPSSLALLQYTSGSTRSPRGVRVTHANVLANERAIAKACEHDRESHFVGWLPLFHDMGLIADVLQPLFLGSSSVLMPPAAFLRDPVRWLAAMGRYGGVAGGGPNFAYDLCVSRISAERRADLDLSTWRTAFNGAEVVRASTLDRFARAFSPAGFVPEAFFSCYGLAEATLIVAGAPRRRPPVVLKADPQEVRAGRLRRVTDAGEPGRAVVSSGRVVEGTTVVVVERGTGAPLPEGTVGELWVRGPGVADGCWRQPAASTDFTAVPAGGGAPHLRTGDLGALVDGELYVLGRSKDLLVVRGTNHHPDDLEWTVEQSTPDVRPSCVAVFSDGEAEDGRERVVAVVEPASGGVAARLPLVAAALRSAVAGRHGLEVDEVVLVARGAVPKTTSGKVRRSACRDALRDGGLRVLGRSRARTTIAGAQRLPDVEELLALPVAAAARRLARAVVTAAAAPVPDERLGDVRLSELGLDSVRAVELQHCLELGYAADLPPFSLLGDERLVTVCGTLVLSARTGRCSSPSAAPEGGSGPASLVQSAMILERELAPPGPAYLLTRALLISRPLDVAALEGAVDRLVQRHAALRTTLSLDDGRVVQAEHALSRALSVRPAARDVGAAIEAEAARDLDPKAGGLVRFVVIPSGSAEWVLVLRAHHAVVDFWSVVVLVRELVALYDEGTGGPLATLSARGPGPLFHARREAALLASPEGDELRRYWATRLAGAPRRSALPHPLPRPPTRLFHGDTVQGRIDARSTTRLRALAAASDCTLFTVLLAGMHVLTARLTGRPDIVVGTFATMRDSCAAASVGCLTNLLPVRLVLDPAEDVRTLLSRLRTGLTADLARSRLPFPEIVRTADPGRDPALLPLVQTAVVLQREPGEADEGLRALALGVGGRSGGVNGLEVDVLPVQQRWTHLDLTLDIAEVDGGLTVVAQFDVAVHDRASAELLLEQWQTVLEGMARRPDTPVGEVPLLSDARRTEAVAHGTGPAVPVPSVPLHGLVDQRCRAEPDRVALAAPRAGGSEHLTAAGVRTWAARLSSRVAADGAGPASRVGILLDRCVALPVAMLAVLRLGAAYVPLDPSDPPERIAWMAADAGVQLVLTDEGHRHLVPTGLRAVPVAPGAEPRRAAGPVHPELPAYVLYTSGSTGRPKGVVVPHRAIANRLRWMQRALPLRPDDRVLQRTPTTFDVSVWELFWPLIDGAVLVLAPPGSERDPEWLADVLRREQVTVAHSVPTALDHLLPHLDVQKPAVALRRLVSSGEALPAAVRDRFHRLTSAELHNMYGPTEAAVDVTWWPCSRADTGPVPIGWPIDGTQVHVLGPDGSPVPAGAPGEVVIAGIALAHGYSGRPGLTAAAWRPHPFGAPGARAYRTGDRGSRGRNGEIRFLGRRDAQVSVAGRRVELGEVEEVLRRAPGVMAGGVVARDDGDGVQLVGFVVPSAGQAPATEQVRAWLRGQLPAALVPSDLRVVLDLPVQVNGKLDRQRLATLAATPYGPPSQVGLADDHLQRRISAVWRTVLGAAQVEPDDDFFALGGDSITALRVVAALGADGVHVRVADVLASPSVRGLARTAATNGPTDPIPAPRPFGLCPPDVVGRLPAGVVDAFPVTSAQLALLFHQLHGERHESYVTSLHLEGPYDGASMRAAAAAVSERHPYLRSSFDLTVHREPLQLVHGLLDLPVEQVDLRGLSPTRAGARLTEWLRRERTRPVDVELGPLARLTVHLLPSGTWQLTLSSFALDGWATSTVLTELLAAHSSGASGPAPRAHYRTFVALEAAAAADDAHARFWREELADARVRRLPPPDRDVPMASTTRRTEVPMAEDTAHALRRLARKLHVSERTLLLAGHLRVVRALTGVRTVVTGVELSGRPEEPDGDRVVGVFNNILPLRVEVSGSWTELIASTAAAERRAAPFRRYPFAKLERDLGRPGLVQTLFVHTHFHLYRDLAERAGVRVLDSSAPDRTHVPLTAHTNVDAVSGQIRLLIDVDPREVDDRTAALAAELYPRVWAAMAADPELSCTAVPAVTGRALRAQLEVSDGGDGPTDPSGALDLVLRQARRTPERVAVRAGHVHWTYSGLVRRALALGSALQAAGVAPDAVVAVPARRTPDLLVAVLGTWACGAAYLPVPPAEPLARTRRTCEAAGVRHVVAKVEDALAGVAAVIVPPSAGEAARRPSAASDPRLLAYVLPTSGSTGTPKLVGVPQGALVNYLAWCSAAYGGPGRTLVHSAVEFDLTVTSLLGPLVVGGTVELLPDGAGAEAAGAAVAGMDGPLKITPAHLAVMADQLLTAGERAPDVLVVAGGEHLTGRQVRAWRESGGRGPIINEYGPTEATVGCLTWRLPKGAMGSTVPVGRPIPGTRARVLDGVDAVADTVSGELAIGGRGLARGYLAMPGLTAARFLPDAYGLGERLFLTGDAARRDRDGLVHVLGRLDRQVKVRGRRVEPAATEAVLRTHPDVRAAAVTAVPTGADTLQLVGYWVSESADVPGPDALSAWLRRQLPAHQVPDVLMWLPILPLTARGKVDTAALPDPRGGTQQALAELLIGLSDEEVRALLAQEAEPA